MFCDSREGLASPDLQLLFTPGSTHPLKFGQLDEQPGMSCVVCVVKPDSRGTIMAASPDPFARPAIKPNYLTAHTDELALLGGTRHVRKIFAAPALAQHSKGEIQPGPDLASDADLLAYARRSGNTLYHPVGTCKMGEDPRAVVDSRLRVRGIAGPAGDRRLGDADAHHRQHQRAHDHDRREGCRDDRGGCSGLV